jgi:TRIAD3 protein (E3 ubiquitin-protein ligase RNF216)
MPNKCLECNEGHVFCQECIIRGTQSKLADGEAHVHCFTICKNEFSIATLQTALPPTMFSTLLKKRQAAEIMAADVDGLVSCPFCHFASIPPLEDKVFKCLNPDCMKETCR